MEISDFLNKNIDNIRLFTVIGVTGTKGSGKDTFCKLIKQYNNSFEIKSFAGPLKDGLSKIFSIQREYFDDQSMKEVELFKINIDEKLKEIEDYFQIKLDKKELVATTVRQLMQFVGTEYVQSADKEFWAKRLISGIKPGQNTLISDVRFFAENKIISDNGGFLIRINRIGREVKDSHKSETEQFEMTPLVVLNVNDGDFETLKRAARIFAFTKYL